MKIGKLIIPISLSLIITALYLFIPVNKVVGERGMANVTYSAKFSDAKTMLDTKCMVCHSIKDSHEAMLAPPFAHIKKKYTKMYPKKEDFIKAFTDFTTNPTTEKAVMFGALKQFKVMPNMGFKKEEAEQIATYVFENDFPVPEWQGGKGQTK